MNKQGLKHIVAAGSWDRFHVGHENFLDKAFEISKKVSVGVTADEMILNKVLSRLIEPYSVRKQKVVEYLKSKNYLSRAKLVKLDDIYGPALEDTTLEGLLVTSSTVSGGEKVNKKRQELSLPLLQLIKAEMLKSSNGQEISSKGIRAGKINRAGVVYFEMFTKFKTFRLTKEIRARLKKPFGELILGSGNKVLEKVLKRVRELKPVLTICVGDVVTQLFISQKQEADLFIVDLTVERKRRFLALEDLGFTQKQLRVKVSNPAGLIRSDMADKILKAINKAVVGKETPVILVEGEEDLAVIPAVLTAPLNSVVLYGQPGKGIVLVKVTEEKKQQTYDLLKQFKAK